MFVEVRFLGVRFNRLFDFRSFLGRGFSPFSGRVFVCVGVLHFRFFPGLNSFDGSSGGRVLPTVFLLVQNFLIVGDVAWIGHRPKNRR